MLESLLALFHESSGWRFFLTILDIAIVYYAINSLRFIPQSTFDAKRLTARTQMLMLSEHATKAPLQFVWADGDPIANIEMGREMHQLYPNARYTELPGLGHFLLMEDPAAVAREIRTFAEGDAQ